MRLRVGVGPVSVSTSTGGRGGSGCGPLFLGVLVIGLAVYAATWPYRLGTYVAVAVFKAGPHSVGRSVSGWIPEGLWIAFLVLALVGYLTEGRGQKKPEDKSTPDSPRGLDGPADPTKPPPSDPPR